MDDNYMVINELELKGDEERKDYNLEMFKTELTKLINKHSIDNYIGMPDYIISNSFIEQIKNKEIYFVMNQNTQNLNNDDILSIAKNNVKIKGE